jgi:CheY-like chemotaxis protein
MERQLSHLVRMVDDLLDISRVTLGKVRLVEGRVDLHHVVTSAAETARSQLDAHGVELVLDPAAAWPSVHGDGTRLAQVVANLLHNAAKYTPRGGRVTVTSASRGDRAEIVVADTGIGIPPDKLLVVFEMFAQLEPAAGRSNGGLGIGLTLARRLVELHGGTIEARSEGLSRGATFIMRLPLLSASEPPLPARVEPEPHDGGRRILVVDDNVDAAEMLATLLEIGGHIVRVVHTGHEALEVIAEHRPDVVLLDIGLPGIDGYEVARRIRDDSTLQQPLLVALTGWGAAEDRRQAREAGFDVHLVKPIDQAQLAAVLATTPARRTDSGT